ncbi:MAG: GNAT family N-acetyltransferase, partial [Thermoplasmata archaeon]
FYIIIPVGIVLLVYGIYYLIRWSSKSIDSQAIGIVKVKRITSPKDLPPLTGKSSRFFEPFYENMILKAVKAKDTAAVAVSGTHGVVGFGVYHKDVDIGSIFAPETDVNETIRSFLGCKDFFSETRHKPVRPRAQGSYAFMIGGPTDKPESYYAQDVYNIFETYKVLINRNLFPVEYDRNLIRPMRQEDLPAIAEISKKVYKVDGMKWYSLLLQMGEIGLVAELKGQIVGYTFITVCDNHARFHTNTVDPAMQNKGIGKELMKARISIAYHLGCTDAMCEIADWNLPSLQIALSHGFVPEGKMYVETIRTQKVEKKFIRR